jgi:BirA family biotin operon repressor/biotin-[acetyl-CoA-carboxylase] ligase
MLGGPSLREAVRAAGIEVEPVYLDVTDSTNITLLALAEAGAPAWTVVAAGEQTAGRGRMGRPWFAPAGTSLALSVLLRPSMPAPDVPVLALAAGAAMAEACGAAGVEVRCKWPNDLVAGGRKLGGILCEAAVQGGRVLHVGVGVGVNLGQRREDFAEDLRGVATSLVLQGTAHPDAAPLVTGFLAALREMVEGPPQTIGPRVVERYRPLCDTIGRLVRATTSSGAMVEGEAVAVSDGGDLMVRTEHGVERVGFGEVQHLR